MSTTLIPPRTPDIGSARPDPPDDRRPPHRRPGRRFLAVTLSTAALLGGTAGAGVVALTGDRNRDGSATTATTVASSASDTTDTSATSLDASAVYASVSAGVVEITATGTSSSQSGPLDQGSSASTATGSGFVLDARATSSRPPTWSTTRPPSRSRSPTAPPAPRR